MGVESAERDRCPLDDNTQTLIEYFAAVNWGGMIGVFEYGTLKETVVTAAVLWGVRRGEIKFIWLKKKRANEKEFGIKLVETENGKQVVATFDIGLVNKIESNVQKFLPGGMVSEVTDMLSYVAEALKKRGGFSTDIAKEVTKMIIEIYRLYRQI